MKDDTVVGHIDHKHTGVCSALTTCVGLDKVVRLSDLTTEIQTLIRAGLAAKGLSKSTAAWMKEYGDARQEALGNEIDFIDYVEGGDPYVPHSEFCAILDMKEALAAYQAAIGGDE